MDIQPIVTTNPVVTEPVPAKTYDTWFLTDFRLSATADRKFAAEIFWQLGKLNEDGTSEMSDKRVNHFLPDILNPDTITTNPEIASLVPQFMSALAAISKRANII